MADGPKKIGDLTPEVQALHRHLEARGPDARDLFFSAFKETQRDGQDFPPDVTAHAVTHSNAAEVMTHILQNKDVRERLSAIRSESGRKAEVRRIANELASGGTDDNFSLKTYRASRGETTLSGLRGRRR